MANSNATNDGTPVTLIGAPYAFGSTEMSLAEGPRVALAEKILPSRLRKGGVEFRIEWVQAGEPLPEDHLVQGDQILR